MRRISSFSSLLALAFAVAGPGVALAQDDAPTEQSIADQNFADQDWEAAAANYEALLAEDGANATNWFRLGRARQQLGEAQAARDAFEQAIANEFPVAGRVRYFLAQVHMALGDEEAALGRLEELVDVGGPNFRVIQNDPVFSPLADAPRFLSVIEALKPCNTEEYRQFDFWLGEWDVTPASVGRATASNSITNDQDGCVVFERYATGGFTGISMSFYDATLKKWHQTWMSNAGGSVYLEGGLNENGQMVLTNRDLPIAEISGSISRVTWTPNEDGSVRQYWENSTDGGETWTVGFDGLYELKVSDE